MNKLLRECRFLLMLPLVFAIFGCSDETLYSMLSEREANEMVALLVDAGIVAEKASDKDGKFKVMTEKPDFARAVNLLRVNGFPKESYDTLGDVFAKEGFVSSPLEERARLNFALSQEIANTLSNVDGVLLARVHLAVPPKDDLSKEIAPASASVFIKHRSDVDLSASTSMIKNLVVNGIENLAYSDVTVAFFKSSVSVGAKAEAATTAMQQRPSTQMQLSLLPSMKPVHLALVALSVGFLLLLGSFWRRKPVQSSSAQLSPDQPSENEP